MFSFFFLVTGLSCINYKIIKINIIYWLLFNKINIRIIIEYRIQKRKASFVPSDDNASLISGFRQLSSGLKTKFSYLCSDYFLVPFDSPCTMPVCYRGTCSSSSCIMQTEIKGRLVASAICRSTRMYAIYAFTHLTRSVCTCHVYYYGLC